MPAGHETARRRSRDLLADAIRKALRGKRRGGGSEEEPGGDPCPVVPRRPLDLSGGAAAALEFDD